MGDPGSYPRGWRGGCTSPTADCTFTVDSDLTLETGFSPPNRIFTTQATFTLDQLKARATDPTDEISKTVSGADAICEGLGGPGFRAWIARWGGQLPAGVRGFVRPDGREVVAELAPQSQVLWPPTMDETGAPVAAPALLWSGITSAATIGRTCHAWDGTETMTVGHAHGMRLVDQEELPCDPELGLHLLCLETRYDAFVAPPPLPDDARLVFVSSFSMLPASRDGLAQADTICEDEASRHGLPGTYRAMLATDAASMASRFAVRPDPIYRVDGVSVTPDLGSLFSGVVPGAPIAIRANGAVASWGTVWTGSAQPLEPGASDDVCLDPTRGPWNARGPTTGLVGDALDLSRWLGHERIVCGRAASVYCLQE